MIVVAGAWAWKASCASVRRAAFRAWDDAPATVECIVVSVTPVPGSGSIVIADADDAASGERVGLTTVITWMSADTIVVVQSTGGESSRSARYRVSPGSVIAPRVGARFHADRREDD